MTGAAYFGVVDYVMLGLTVAVSLAIGVYHGFQSNKTAEDFAMGSRSMTPLPVSLSLLATFLSANSILGYSGEVYGHGLGLAWTIPATILAILFASEVVLPVLYPLKLVSPNQYLEIRFQSPWLRRLSMTMTFMSIIVFMGLALYAPTLALAAVTPLTVSSYIWIMGIVVTIYASFGGLKAVVWADVFQMLLMVGGVLLVTVMACIDAGGVSNAWQIASEGGRTEATNIDVNPQTRHTVWNVLLLVTVNWGCHYSVSQANYQRVSAVSTISKAKRVLYYNIIGMTVFTALVFFMGVCIYSVYAGCDPYAKGLIFSKDQVAAYYVSDRLSHLTGIPGIFVATLLSAALSSLSSGVNTLATLFWADILSHMSCFKEASDFTAATASKLLTVCLGALTIGLAFLASKMGGLIQAGYTVVGVMAGPVFGVYMLGMAVPFCNKKGAFFGILSGWGLSVWIAVGGAFYKSEPKLLPFSIDDCPIEETSLQNNLTSLMQTAATIIRTNTTATALEAIITTESSVATSLVCPDGETADCVGGATSFGLTSVYMISYTFYPLIGLFTCLIVGMIVSLITGYQDPKKVPSELLLVCLRKFIATERDVDDADLPQGKLSKAGTVETLVLDNVSVSQDPARENRIRY